MKLLFSFFLYFVLISNLLHSQEIFEITVDNQKPEVTVAPNTLDKPFLVKPVESLVSFNTPGFNVFVPSESFEVYVFDL